MKPHESPRIKPKSIRGDSGGSWPVWNRGIKGALTRYGKLIWGSAHAWNLIILCLLIAWGMTSIFMVNLSFYAIPLLIYDVMFDITTIP